MSDKIYIVFITAEAVTPTKDYTEALINQAFGEEYRNKEAELTVLSGRFWQHPKNLIQLMDTGMVFLVPIANKPDGTSEYHVFRDQGKVKALLEGMIADPGIRHWSDVYRRVMEKAQKEGE